MGSKYVVVVRCVGLSRWERDALCTWIDVVDEGDRYC